MAASCATFRTSADPAMAPPRRLPVILCFAGQGTQYYHMAADLYRDHAVFRQWLRIGDEVVRESRGFSLIAEVFDDRYRPTDPFARLEATHPAVFLVQYALAKVL